MVLDRRFGELLATRNGGDLRYYGLASRCSNRVKRSGEGSRPRCLRFQVLDLAYGRQETWEDSPVGWPQDKAGSWCGRDGRPVVQWTRTTAVVK
jgi:hypothetical protein